MENQQPVMQTEKPQGFPKLLGRIIAIVLAATAVLVGLVALSDGPRDSAPSSQPSVQQPVAPTPSQLDPVQPGGKSFNF